MANSMWQGRCSHMLVNIKRVRLLGEVTGADGPPRFSLLIIFSEYVLVHFNTRKVVRTHSSSSS
jgi:hypothetical protein